VIGESRPGFALLFRLLTWAENGSTSSAAAAASSSSAATSSSSTVRIPSSLTPCLKHIYKTYTLD